MSKKYSLEEMLLIYSIALKHFNAYETIPAPIKIEDINNCIFLNKIHKDYGDNRTISGLKDKLTERKDRKNHIAPLFTAAKDKIIKNKNYNKTNFLNFEGCELIKSELDLFLEKNSDLFLCQLLDDLKSYSTDVLPVIESRTNNKTEKYAVIYNLLKNGKASFKGEELIMIKNNDKANIMQKEKNSSLLNTLRAKNGEFYGFNDDSKKPSIKHSNDGTGLGKSYAAMDKFINGSKDKNISQLFTSPQKNQLGIDPNLATKANELGIRIVQALSRSDFTEMDSINMAMNARSTFDSNAIIKQYLLLEDTILCNHEKSKENKSFQSLSKNIDKLIKDLNGSEGDKFNLEAFLKKAKNKLKSLRGGQEELSDLNNTFNHFNDNNEEGISLKSIETQIKNCKTQIEYSKSGLLISLKNLIVNIVTFLRRNSKDEMFFYSKDESGNFKYEKLLNLYEMLYPFDVAKNHKTIILMTSDKFKTSVDTIFYNPKTRKCVNRTMKIDNLIGHKKHKDVDFELSIADESNINENFDVNLESNGSSVFEGLLSGLNKTDAEKTKLIEENFLEIDETNEFREKGIRFDIIIDEEHSAYNKFNKECFKELLNKNENIEHIIASAKRVTYSSDPDSVNSKFKENIYKGMLMQYQKVYGANSITREEVEKKADLIFDLFLNNNAGMNLRKNDENTILNITKNNFIFSASKSFEQSHLKKVKLQNDSAGKIIIYYENIENEAINLFDISVIITAIFYAISKIKNTKEELNFIEEIEKDSDQNQNSSLSKVLRKRKMFSQGYLADVLFSERPMEDFEIDYYYVYFIPKLFLTLAPVDNIGKISVVNNYNNGDIKVRFVINTITYPPEVSFIKILSGTQNNIITLSATAGMLDYKGSNYCRDFFDYYKDKFNYNVENKSKNNTKDENGNSIPTQIRNEREKIRSDIKVNFFNSRDIELKPKFEPKHGVKFHQYAELTQSQIEFLNKYKEKQSEKDKERSSNKYYEESKRSLSYFIQNELLSNSNSLMLTLRKSHVSDALLVLKELKKADNIKGVTIKDNSISFSCNGINGINKKTVIFYDNETLKNNPNWEDDLIVNKENGETVILISYYQVAGTGINLCLQDESFNKNTKMDFDKIFLIDMPHYSEIMDTEKTLDTTENNFLLVRKIAEDNHKNIYGEKIKMSIFKNPLVVNGKFKNYLEKEHSLSLIKEIMQAVGRVERTDNNDFIELYINDSLNVSSYPLLKEIVSNEEYFSGVSLLNYHYITNAIDSIEKNSLTGEQLKNINNKYITAFNFFNDKDNKYGFRRMVLKDMREGDLAAIEFNKLLRSRDCYMNPEKYIQKLISSDYVNNSEYKDKLQAVINSLYFNDIPADFPLYHNTGMLYGDINEKYEKFSDYIENKNSNFENKNYIITDAPNLDNVEDMNEYHDLYKLNNWYTQEKMNNIKDILNANEVNINYHINPVFYSLLKGNYAENIFDTFFNKMVKEGKLDKKTRMIDTEELLTISPSLIEKYDFYIETENSILAIDIKSFSDVTIDSKYSYLQKIQQMKYESLVPLFKNYSNGKEIKCIYLNVVGKVRDSVEILDNFLNKNIHNMLFFVNKKTYETVYNKKTDTNGKEITVSSGTRFSQNIIISENLIRLLEGKI